MNMRKLSLILAGLLAVMPNMAFASTTVILTTTTYTGAGLDISVPIASALPQYGPYFFTLSVTPVSASITNFNAYLTQKGLSGSLYTLANSTFTSCSGTCNLTVQPDVYEGGTIVPRWSIASGSATVVFTAYTITP